MALETDMLGPSPASELNQSSGSGTTTPSDEEFSKQIKYKLQYKNDAGEPIFDQTSYKPWSKLTTDDDEEGEAVLDIVTYVTIRQLSVSTPVDSKETATAAGKTSEALTNDSTPKTGKDKGLKIESIGGTEMIIRSSSLVKAIRTVVDYYPSQQLAGRTITVAEPYHFLLHHRQELESVLQDKPIECGTGASHVVRDEKTISSVKVLNAFLDSKYAKKIAEEEARHKKYPPTATFEMLWMLLKPGTRVYRDFNGVPAAFVVKSAQPDKATDPTYYDVNLWWLDFDGENHRNVRVRIILIVATGRRIGRVVESVTFSGFSGEREISTLKIYPIAFATDKKMQPRLERLGRLYFDILQKGSEQFNYDGHSMSSTKRYVGTICPGTA